ncbi:dihydroxyacetone kinase subunit DhaL [Vagococcus carniphilus]|uniref:dihydroxyacetone kinase subunit DhaL n=1 Tax=Vagococcus carniphilus TaxID=218144 RepID=UPI0028903536|nr:dihydroxyacetone kinase subunit DhaL [Vagococcus carniphilus]MDT2831231.1 dihydroxyacetone kinase subunit DhaL [Vagococcus carniphilus]MDT2839610.1 dihydroxyacetone kinase subunit DhaL [Vagococcus carniphilus]MDT2854079.1 dihydroxyacetone kinase subunit DhaL [Vagococcus carniphilus]
MDVKTLKKWLQLFTEKVVDNKQYLSDLDTPIGDGDHGANMARGTTEMMKAIVEKNPETVTDTLKLAAMTLIGKVGGASGPLYGSAFMGMTKASMTSENIVDILEAGLADIQKRGKAEVGEKTMVDTWAPVIEALKNDELTVEKIQGFAEATKDIKATKGRASYLGDRSIGHIDPGSQSSAYLFEAMLEAGVK